MLMRYYLRSISFHMLRTDLRRRFAKLSEVTGRSGDGGFGDGSGGVDGDDIGGYDVGNIVVGGGSGRRSGGNNGGGVAHQNGGIRVTLFKHEGSISCWVGFCWADLGHLLPKRCRTTIRIYPIHRHGEEFFKQGDVLPIKKLGGRGVGVCSQDCVETQENHREKWGLVV
ncbi:hypothetical protein AAG570_006213 [Ranatra chinensis]|uniref:Uncharacterized protein n=1 Tax=Ranatra chinensis TaxID=642074 RepID=A0ABD0Z3Y1_9HEMI